MDTVSDNSDNSLAFGNSTNTTGTNVEITDEDIENFVKKYDIIEDQENPIETGDVVSYNGKYYLAKPNPILGGLFDEESIKNNDRYNLYSFDGKLYKSMVKRDEIELVMSNALYKELVQEKTKELLAKEKNTSSTETSSGGSSGGGSSGGGGSYSGGSSYNRSNKNYNVQNQLDTNNATQNGNSTQTLSETLGTTDQTKRTLQECQGTIDKAKNAIKTANITVKSWEDTQNTQGYATDASIVFLNNLTNALDILEKNLDKTKVSALEVNALNTSVKDLLIEYTEKKEKEDELKPKEEKIKTIEPKIETTDSNGNKTTKDNEEYTKLQKEITTLKEEITKIDKNIEELKNEIDARFKKIKENYGNLLNFDSSSNVSITGNNIFGTSGNTNGKSLDINGEVIKNYMVSNNLEYFEFENSIYNIPSPYDPWNKTTINLDEKYLIRYDLNKLQQYANSGNEIAAGAIEFLKGKASGKIPDSVRYFVDTSDDSVFLLYNNGRYQSISGNYKGQIQQVVDTVLKDSYVSNNCKTVTDYATTSMMTMSGGIFNPSYSGSAKPTQNGASGVMNGADCIGAVNWAMCQGIIHAENNSSLKPLGLGYGLRPISNGYNGSDLCEVGTVFTKQTSDNWHTGMVVGHTTVNGKKYNVMVHTGNRQYGFNAHIVGDGSFDTAITAEQLKGAYYA